MKYLAIAALLALAAARPQEEVFQESESQELQGEPLENSGIISQNQNTNADGSFQYDYKTDDPAEQSVTGQQKQIGEGVGTVMQGTYSFADEDGNVVTVTWTADENGFQAQGDAIPVAPEDPNAAAQQAAYAAAAARGETPEPVA